MLFDVGAAQNRLTAAVKHKFWQCQSNCAFCIVMWVSNEKLFNSLPLWMPNNPITKIQVIVMKIRTLILISCKETGSDCKGYAYLVTKVFSNSRYFLNTESIQSWEWSEHFLNDAQQQLIKIKTIFYPKMVNNRRLLKLKFFS